MAFNNSYPEKKINEITSNDTKLRVLGFIVDKNDDALIIDDGTGKMRIFVESKELIDNFDINQLVRVFGNLIAIDQDVELRSDIIQDMSNFDLELHKKTIELYDKLGV